MPPAARALNDFVPHSPEHLEQIRRRIEKDFNEMCTGCGYCLPCPQGIPIPRCMDVHNLMQLKASDDEIRARFKYHWDMAPDIAAQCVECGQCEARCTQHLPIMARLKKVAAFRM